MTSEKQKNAGYIIPEQINDYDLLCVQMFIPNNLDYIAAFSGQLWELGTWFTWEKSYTPGDTRASQAAAYWRYLLDTYLCIQFNKPREDDGMPCCDDDKLLSRFTADGVFQTSSDGGVTWADNPGLDPRNDAVQSPPIGGSEPGVKCAAADNVRDVFKTYRDQLVALLTAGTTFLAIIAGLIGALGVLLGLSVVASSIGVLLFGIAAGLLTLTPTEAEAALDDTFMEQFKCIVFCHMHADGTVGYDDWQGILADINTSFSGFTLTFFKGLTQAMGYIGINNAATIGVSTASDCDDCGCGWCYTFDFEATNGGFTIVPTTGGFYEPGVGWKSDYWVGGDGNGYRAVDIKKDFVATVTSMDIAVHVSGQGTPPYNPNWVYAASNIGALITSGSTPVAPEDVVLSWEGLQSVTGLSLVQVSAGFGSGGFDPGGEVVIKTITLRGTGSNPFGDSNCDI